MGFKVYRSLAILALLVSSGDSCPTAGGAEPTRVSETRRLMGVLWTITLYASDVSAGEQSIQAAFAEIGRLEEVLSDYDPESELSRLSTQAASVEPTPVSDDLWRVMVTAEDVRRRTDGGFDISIGPLTSLWRQARKSGRLPRPDKLAAARACVGPGTLELFPDRQAVRLPNAGTRLDPGGIGMGYAADRAMELLAARGITVALIDASGDILVSGPPPGAAGWRIEIAPLEPGGKTETLILTQAAVTTSGDAYQAVEIEGIRYSHIVDPRTGIGVQGPAAATVIAPDATTADALATAVSVLGPDQGFRVVATFPGTAARCVWRVGTEMQVQRSPGWPGR
jgi:thiamine biosynthesis lipoprotein